MGLVFLGLINGLTACHRPAKPGAGERTEPTARSEASPDTQPGTAVERPDFALSAVSASEGEATWYDVPEGSLPQRRAWPGEFTAASSRLPRGTLVRVTRLDGPAGAEPKVIVARITDDGVGRHVAMIDLDRPAAEALDMVRAGRTRVRVEVLKLEHASTEKTLEPADERARLRPKTVETLNRVGASQREEKEAAAKKDATGEETAADATAAAGTP